MMLWESGYPPALGKSSTEKKSNEKSGKTGFNEKPWASHTASYLTTIKMISDAKWEEIYTLAPSAISSEDAKAILAIMGDSVEGSDDPRSCVNLSDDGA
jgi:hypothetical protein